MVGLALLLWPVPAVWTLLACLAGRGARSEGVGWWNGRVALMVATIAGVALLIFAANSDLGFATRALLAGWLFGAALVPTAGFYALGYRVRNGRLSGGLWFAGTLPLTAYAAV